MVRHKLKKKLYLFSILIITVLTLVLIPVTALAEEGNTLLTAIVPCIVSFQIGPHGNVNVEDEVYSGETSMYADKGSVVVYFFNPDESYSVEKVTYNGEEITEKVIGGKFTAPEILDNAVLLVTFKKYGRSEEKDDPGQKGTNVDHSNIETGDHSYVQYWIVLFIVCTVAIALAVVILIIEKKRKRLYDVHRNHVSFSK